MNDSEKIIKGLESQLDDLSQYADSDEVLTLTQDQAKDILSLLKEQVEEIEHLKRPDCEHAEHDSIGCLGYCGCTQDDEPIEACKSCEKYTGNVSEAMKWE